MMRFREVDADLLSLPQSNQCFEADRAMLFWRKKPIVNTEFDILILILRALAL